MIDKNMWNMREFTTYTNSLKRGEKSENLYLWRGRSEIQIGT